MDKNYFATATDSPERAICCDNSQARQRPALLPVESVNCDSPNQCGACGGRQENRLLVCCFRRALVLIGNLALLPWPRTESVDGARRYRLRPGAGP